MPMFTSVLSRRRERRAAVSHWWSPCQGMGIYLPWHDACYHTMEGSQCHWKQQIAELHVPSKWWRGLMTIICDQSRWAKGMNYDDEWMKHRSRGSTESIATTWHRILWPYADSLSSEDWRSSRLIAQFSLFCRQRRNDDPKKQSSTT
jgi:hypothetical protein